MWYRSMTVGRRMLWGGLAALVLTCLALPTIFWFFGIRNQRDMVAYIGMYQECHPVWRHLAMRRIHQGLSVAAASRVSAPFYIENWDRYTLMYYNQVGNFTGLQVLARDNQLIWAHAGSCTWRHEFFRTIPEAEIDAIFASYYAHRRTRSVQRIPPAVVLTQAPVAAGP